MNLSRRALLLVALVLLLGATGQWAPADMQVFGLHAAHWWRYPAGLLLLLLIIETLSARLIHLPVNWQLPGRLRLGHSQSVALRLRNPFPRPLELEVYLRDSPALRLADASYRFRMPPGGSRQTTVTVTPTALGSQPLQAAPLRLLGRFGLAWWNRYGQEAPCEVIPDSLHKAEVRAGTRAEGQLPLQQRGHGLDLLALREYRPGDSMRRVSWKATARSSRLIVQERVEEKRLELVLVLDAGRASGLQMDTSGSDGADTMRMCRLHHNINIAARLAELALASGDRLTLVAYAGGICTELLNLSGQAGLHRLRGSLQGLAPSAEESNPLTAAMAVRRLRQPRSLVVWLTDLDSGDHDALVRAARMLTPRHLPLIGTATDPALARLATRPATDWSDPQASLAAMQARQNLMDTEIRLRRLGAEVVSAAPARLDSAMLTRYQSLRGAGRV